MSNDRNTPHRCSQIDLGHSIAGFWPISLLLWRSPGRGGSRPTGATLRGLNQAPLELHDFRGRYHHPSRTSGDLPAADPYS